MDPIEDMVASVLASMNDSPSRSTGDSSKTMQASVATKASVAKKPSPPSAPAGATQPKKKAHRHKEVHSFPVEPRVIQIVQKPKTYANHTYRDFSSVPPKLDYEAPKSIEEMSFSQKVHDILSQDEYKDFIDWCPHGRAFRVLVPKCLEKAGILKKYFGHSRYSSFLRQLSNHGFKHITQGPDRNCYYHEFMLRGLPHLCIYMPPAKDARRLIPDPGNELDFYRISKLYPVPGCEKVSDSKNPGLAGSKNPIQVSTATPSAAIATVLTQPTVGASAGSDLVASLLQERPTKLPRVSLGGTIAGTQPLMDVGHARILHQLSLAQQIQAQQQQQQQQQQALAAYAAQLSSGDHAKTLKNLLS